MRSFVKILLAIVPALLAAGTSTAQNIGNWSNGPEVKTHYGIVRGFSDKHQTWAWKGIPFASPPVGELRWKAPVDPVPWEGVRKARKYGSPANQAVPVIGAVGSEDCLYLNIWRPKSGETGLPVYFYIHGGGNSLGTSGVKDYDGALSSNHSNMIFVTANYRLGVMGWLRHPAITGSGSEADQSGNFGTLDLIQALKWVKENIAAFGGDPNQVTIAGESAGGINVLSLLISPTAKGLFHRAVSESGLTLLYKADESERATNQLLKNLLVVDGLAEGEPDAAKRLAGMTPAEINEYLRGKSPGELMKNFSTMDAGMAKWPTVLSDGYVIPKEGYQAIQSGRWANPVPLLIGVNKDEAALFRYMAKDPKPGTRGYEILTEYQSLLWRIGGLDSIATLITAHPDAPPVFAYRFDWGAKDEQGISVLPRNKGEVLGAHHYAEIPFFYGNGPSQLSVIVGRTFSAANRKGREKLTNLCMRFIGNFAHTGNPNGEGVPLWEPWKPLAGADKLIILDATRDNLRISSSNETIHLETLIHKAENELSGEERTDMLRIVRNKMVMGK